MTHPDNKTIRKVVLYLAKELNLSIYGQMVNLNTGQEDYGCRDFSATDITKYRKLVEQNKLWRDEEQS